jgi:UDP-N-acetylmuramyl pentapeptide phosphotransferase/UDP-N-acetylglucosamine-1-phosphate transferase
MKQLAIRRECDLHGDDGAYLLGFVLAELAVLLPHHNS